MTEEFLCDHTENHCQLKQAAGHPQAVSPSSPTCCLSRAGIFILGTELCQAPSVAAVHAHTLLALSKAHLAHLDIQGNRNSSLVQLQELLILPRLPPSGL